MAAGLPVPPPPAQRVNDYAGALGPTERAALEHRLAERARVSSNQVVVALFRSLEGESLEDYSIRVAETWRIGQRDLDNGVILLVFLDERRIRIEVGYGLEPVLTDAIASSIIRDTIAPRFRQGRLAEGLTAGVDAIESAIAGTYSRPAPRRGERSLPVPLVALAGLVVLIGVALPVAGALATGRRVRRNGWTTGGGRWGAGPYVGGSDWLRPGWPGGGLGRRGGGFRGGGFSGGGGGFGGGGASGSW